MLTAQVAVRGTAKFGRWACFRASLRRSAMSMVKVLALTLVGAGLAAPTSATVMLDQSPPPQGAGSGFAIATPINTNLPFGQSFTAGFNGTFSKFDFLADRAATLTYDVRLGDGTAGAILGSGSQAVSCDYYDARCHITIDVSPLAIDLVAGQQYTFLLTGITNYTFFSANSAGGYSGGRAYLGTGYAAYGDMVDLHFRTYVDVPDAVPEPAMLGLFGLGVISVAARRRRA